MILDYKGIRIFYEDKGKGDVILLLHGFLENSKMWDYIPSDTFERKRFIKIDLLGHGKTECMGYVHTMDAMAEAALAVVGKLNVKRFKIIGHSMGGYVALAMLKIKPELILGICLMNSTFQADTKNRKLIRKRAIEMAKTNYEALVRMSFINLFAENSRSEFKEEIDKALKDALKTPVQGYIAAQEGMLRRASRLDVLENSEMEIQMILGRQDAIVNIDEIKALSTDLKVKIDVISSGHMSHIENKSELTYLIKQFNEK